MKKLLALFSLLVFLFLPISSNGESREWTSEDDIFFEGLLNAYDYTNAYLHQLNILRVDYAKAPISFDDFLDAYSYAPDEDGEIIYRIELKDFINHDFKKGETIYSRYYYGTYDRGKETVISNGSYLNMSNSIEASSFFYKAFLMTHTNLSVSYINDFVKEMILSLTPESTMHFVEPYWGLNLIYAPGALNKNDLQLLINHMHTINFIE